MGAHRKNTWEHAHEHAAHWLVSGAILALTGFAPEGWLARTVDTRRHISPAQPAATLSDPASACQWSGIVAFMLI